MTNARVVAVILSLSCIALSPTPSHSAIDLSRPGTIPWMRTQPVGSQVTLDLLMVDQVGAGYLIVREPTSVKETVLVAVGARVKRWQSVEVSGTISRAEDGSLYLSQACVKAYADKSGKIILFPLPKPWNDMKFYFDTVDVTLAPGETDVSDASTVPEAGSMLDSLTEGTIPYARSLADGTSGGTLSGKLLSAAFGAYFYIQEPGTPFGIRVGVAPPNAPLGELLSIVGGTMGTVNGERVILSPTQVTDELTTGTLRKVGMSQRQMGGGDWLYDSVTGAGQRGVTGGVGLNNIGALVTIWGQVTTADYANKFFYIDDGSSLADGSGNIGVKVTWDWQTSGQPIIPPSVGWTVSATGISSITPSLARVLRLRSQDDISLHAPQDTGNPAVAITSPYGTDWHKASNENHIVISGTAADAETGVVSVQVKTGGGQYADAMYDPMTDMWTYDWPNPATGATRIYAKATDFVGRSTETYKDVTVTNVTVIYVSKTGNNTTGASWATAKTTVAGGISAASSGQEVWVAQGTYVECITLMSGVALYGGFAGTETAREQRNWAANQSILDGNKLGSVVTIPASATSSTIIDGFTIRNGTGTLVSGSYYGGGVYCPSGATASPVISRNKIIWNYVSAYGGGIYIGGGAPTIGYNFVTGNDGGYYGGGICLANSTATVANNVITANGASLGGGIYCNTGTTTIVNNTIAVNDGIQGGGIYCNNSVTITGNVLAYNYSGIYQTSTSQYPTIDYNCLYNATADYTNVTLGTGNISDDPGFARVSYGDLHIQPDSPCRNHGINDAVQALPTDIEGKTRILNTTVDMGAYESDGTTYSIPDRVYRVIGTGGNDNNDGSDWTTNAMATVQGAVDKAAISGASVWVEGGYSTPITFAEHIALRPFVYLYGGFTGSADQRGYYTTLDGTSNGRVLAIRGGYGVNIVDEFTIIRGSISTDHGGGIYISNSSPVISSNILQSNTASGYHYGGAIYCFYGSPLISGNFIGGYNKGNTAYYGGGITSWYSKAYISGNYIEYNAATYGGGIESLGWATIVNNFIYRNSAAYQGCGICREGSGSAVIANNTITYNTSTTGSAYWIGGGGIYVSVATGDTVALANNIVAYNRDGIYRYSGSAGSLGQYRNCVYENWGTDNVLRNYVNITSYGTNFSTDPKVVLWWIQAGSSCIDTADTNYAPDDDIENNQRDTAPDVGCYEY